MPVVNLPAIFVNGRKATYSIIEC